MALTSAGKRTETPDGQSNLMAALNATTILISGGHATIRTGTAGPLLQWNNFISDSESHVSMEMQELKRNHQHESECVVSDAIYLYVICGSIVSARV